MKEITIDSEGRFLHWVIPGTNPPGERIHVQNEIAYVLSQNPRTKKLDININQAVDYIEPFDIDNAFYNKHSDIIFAYKKAMYPITANYTAEDIASFPTQQAEAKAWEADNTAQTPLLDFMIANRPSVDKTTLVSRILANAVIYKQVAGPAIGKKQHFEDLLYALKAQHEDPNQPDATQADFDAIVVDFS